MHIDVTESPGKDLTADNLKKYDVLFHNASASFLDWPEFERCIAGGWRGQGYHGPKHPFTVKITSIEHPITKGMPLSFVHEVDELYANSVMFPENVGHGLFRSEQTGRHGSGRAAGLGQALRSWPRLRQRPWARCGRHAGQGLPNADDSRHRVGSERQSELRGARPTHGRI